MIVNYTDSDLLKSKKIVKYAQPGRKIRNFAYALFWPFFQFFTYTANAISKNSEI